MKALFELFEALLLVSTFFFIICLLIALYYIGVFVADMILWLIYWIQQLYNTLWQTTTGTFMNLSSMTMLN